jgi:hypothetical protein
MFDRERDTNVTESSLLIVIRISFYLKFKGPSTVA